jgi:hypothetical protein
MLMTFFTQEKGTLLPEKGQLAKLGGLPPSPGSYAPGVYPAEGMALFNINNDYESLVSNVLKCDRFD